MKNKHEVFGKYLRTLRTLGNTSELSGIKGAPTVAEYLKTKDLNISEQFYRAMENGEKLPAIETITELAMALGDDPYKMFQHYLEDVLPAPVFKKLINPISPKVIVNSPKEALDAKDATLDSYRTTVRKLQANIADDVYRSDDSMVDFLNDHIQWLPLLHYIYMKEREVTEEELRRICKLNNIEDNLDEILSKFCEYRIATVRPETKAKRTTYIVKRFNRAFRLPPTPKGRALRAQWIQLEIDKALRHEQQSDKIEVIQPDKTYSFSIIDSYHLDKLPKINDRITDFIAELHGAGADADDADSQPFFLNLTISPRPEYGPGSTKNYQPNK